MLHDALATLSPVEHTVAAERIKAISDEIASINTGLKRKPPVIGAQWVSE